MGTGKCADSIDEFTVQERTRAREAFSSKLQKLFHQLDSSGDGYLSREEFRQFLKAEEICAWMSLLEISVRDVDELFKAVDDGDGQIGVDEFVAGFSRLQGSATAVDAITIKSQLSQLRCSMRELQKELRRMRGASKAKPSEEGM